MTNEKITLALVDDDASVRKALVRLLPDSSFTISTYGSARDFMKSLKIHIPECLVLDIQMPEFGGIELQNYLLRVGISIPTVVITGRDEEGLRERCQAIGAASFLVKPFNRSALIEAIHFARKTGRKSLPELKSSSAIPRRAE